MKIHSIIRFSAFLAILFIAQGFVFKYPAFAKTVSNKKQATPKKLKIQKKEFKLMPYPQKKDEKKPLPFNFPQKADSSKAPLSQDDKIGLSVGIKAGASAGLTGAAGDLTYSLSQLVKGASIRGGIGYLTGKNSSGLATDDIKLAMVNLDAVYNLENLIPQNSPFQVYLGGGLIYPLKVNKNRGVGAWGAHAYLGSKYSLQENTSIYGELAYTGIKYQADEAALRGMEAMMGYSYSF